jgi:NAD(P)-dependent dehydrogenase (short-subunit alcohol dehydrogenase family)
LQRILAGLDGRIELVPREGVHVMRTVVVGASSGLGRSIATGLGRRGATVALLARRMDRLADAAEEAGPGSLAIACDVTDGASCHAAIREAADRLSGIDALVYATGVGPLGRLVDTSADVWRRTFDTNVIGAALVTAAAIPHLTASKGVAAYLSSVNGSVTPPWPGLGAYASSKAALEKMVEAWRTEHPGVGFTRVIVGDCAGGEGASATEFTAGWDWDLAAELFPLWQERNLLSGSLIEVEALVRVVDTVLQCGVSACIPSVVVAPRPPA